MDFSEEEVARAEKFSELSEATAFLALTCIKAFLEGAAHLEIVDGNRGAKVIRFVRPTS